MASIVYSASENQLVQRFLAQIESEIPWKEFEVCRTIGELAARLAMPLQNVRVAVLFAVTRNEIARILSLGDLMADVKSLVVLADDGTEAVLEAHALRPRYLTWLDPDFSNVLGVLKNMVDLYDFEEGSETEGSRKPVRVKARSPSQPRG